MDDEKIVELFLERNEQAIAETSAKYGALCGKIAYNILGNPQDSEEVVNQALLRLWESIPPQRPTLFSAFLAKVVRNLSLNRLKAEHTQKRMASEFAVSLDELDECIPDEKSNQSDAEHIRDSINAFLDGQKQDLRKIFVLRYFYCYSIEEIAKKTGYSEGKIKTALFRMRKKLRTHLESEGILI